ncbi:hypothetical protein [Sporosarcina jiandibaonis]|uniref:hypothetical protein n=1 Tax=Sporosarcina jiandibaonis TaxID=2715535 RepID=UPI001553DBF2|nr:hypothetical protein [Sporosarcina jiandibaonis]
MFPGDVLATHRHHGNSSSRTSTDTSITAGASSTTESVARANRDATRIKTGTVSIRA